MAPLNWAHWQRWPRIIVKKKVSVVCCLQFIKPNTYTVCVGFFAVKELSFTGTDNSNFSEQAWDPYQEKYSSEAYSEGFDSDAARRLLEFGDDYRNFLDSQSDNCSSLSAANNLDSSLSPLVSRRPNMMQNSGGASGGGSANRSGGWSSSKSASKSPSGDDNTVQRRRRPMDAELDRRRKGSEGSRKVLLDGKIAE